MARLFHQITSSMKKHPDSWGACLNNRTIIQFCIVLAICSSVPAYAVLDATISIEDGARLTFAINQPISFQFTEDYNSTVVCVTVKNVHGAPPIPGGTSSGVGVTFTSTNPVNSTGGTPGNVGTWQGDYPGVFVFNTDDNFCFNAINAPPAFSAGDILTIPTGLIQQQLPGNYSAGPGGYTILPGPYVAFIPNDTFTAIAGQEIINTDPTVVNVTSTTANGAYNASNVISITVQFTESVNVTGTPQLTLETGTTDAVVNYSSGSGTDTLLFQYTVGAGHNSLDLDYTATTSLALNGGTISGTSNADLTLPTPGAAGSLGNNKALVIDTAAPSVASINRADSNPTNGSSIDFTVTFSESVSDIETGDFVLASTGTAAGSIASVSASSGTTVTVTVNTVTGDGDLGLNFDFDNLDSVLDSAGNTVASDFIGQTYTIDNTAPTVSSINRTDADPTGASSVEFTVTFSESVSDIETGDFALTTTGTAAGSISSVSASSGTTVTVTVNTVTGDGDLGLNYDFDNFDSVLDSAGNTVASDFVGQTYTIDNTAPTVSSINRSDSDPTGASSVEFTVTFSESVSDIETGDFALTTTGTAAGSISSVSASSGTTVTVTVNTVTGDGDLGLNYDFDNFDSVLDSAGNTVASDFVGQTYTIDNTAPTVSSINRTDADPTGASSVEFTVTFSESVSDIETGDFALTTTGTAAGSISSVSASSGTTVTVTVNTVTGDGDLGLNFDFNALDSIQDSAGNTAGTDFTGQTYTIDNTAPAPVLTSTAPNPTNLSPFLVTITFAEDVVDFTIGDISVTNGSAGSFTNTTPSRIWNVNIIPAADGVVNVDINSGNVLDMAGNNNVASIQLSRSYDGTAPTVTINQAGGQADPATGEPINFTVVFSEPVSGFSNTDISLSGTASPASSVIEGTGPYNIEVAGMTSAGEVIVEILANVVQDLAGNNNVSSTSTDNTVTYSPPPPSVVSINRGSTDPTNSDSVDFIITFDQSVSGIDTTDFNLASSGTTANVAMVSAASGSTVTVTVNSINGNGTLGVNLVDDDSITNDLFLPLGGLGSGNGSFTGQVYTIDRVVPTVFNVTSTTADGTYYLDETIDVSVQFSETVLVSGTPQITLDTGGTGAVVNYTSGSGTSTLFFTYTVLQGHSSADLDYLSHNALSNGGGEIADGAGNNAALILANPSTAGSLGFNRNLVIEGIPWQDAQFPWLILIPGLVSPNKNINQEY